MLTFFDRLPCAHFLQFKRPFHFPSYRVHASEFASPNPWQLAPNNGLVHELSTYVCLKMITYMYTYVILDHFKKVPIDSHLPTPHKEVRA